MQNISPLPTMRITTDAKTTPKVPTASSYHMLKNTKKNSFPVDWLGKLPLIDGKHKLQSVKSLNNKLVNGKNENFESTSYTHQKQYVVAQLEKTESANAQSLSQTGLAQPLEAGSTHDEVIKMPIQVRITCTLRIYSRRTVYHQRSYNRQLVPVTRKNDISTNNNCNFSWHPSYYLINTRSLFSKVDELQALLFSNPADIIAITESWLYEDISHDLIALSGYKFIVMIGLTHAELVSVFTCRKIFPANEG
jgi:hypothetical protein